MANPQRRANLASVAAGDGMGVFDPQLQQAHVLNATSALVFQHCDGQTTPEQLTELLRRKFNVSQNQAGQMLWLALDELEKANLLQEKITTTQAPRPMLSRRQALTAFAAAGLSLALLPIVSTVEVRAAAGSVYPTLQCVADNGNGTYTAYFGYINTSSSTIVIPFDPSHAKNMFTSEPKYRGQPDTFLPGTHEYVFSVVFDGNKITWMIKEDQAARQQVDASKDSPSCPTTTTTTTTEPTTTTTTTTEPPPTTTTTTPPPPTTTTAQPD